MINKMTPRHYTLTRYLTSIRVVNTAMVLFMITMAVIHSALVYSALQGVATMAPWVRVVGGGAAGVALSFGVLVATVNKKLLAVSIKGKEQHVFPYLFAAFDAYGVVHLLDHTGLAWFLGAGIGLILSGFAYIFQKQSEPIQQLDNLEERTAQAEQDEAVAQQKLADTKQKLTEADQTLTDTRDTEREIWESSTQVLKHMIDSGTCPACGKQGLKGGMRGIAGHKNGCSKPDQLKVILDWLSRKS